MDPQSPIQDPVIEFTLLVAAALLVQLTFERSRIPGLVGLLVIGMLIGPEGAGLLPRGPAIELLGSVGLLYIMFQAGLEVDLQVVRDHKREALAFGGAAFGFSFIPAVAVGLAFGLEWTGALLLGAALSSHTLLSYPMIERFGLQHRRPIVSAVGGTLLTDTAALTLLLLLVHGSGGEDGGWAGRLLPLGLFAALAVGALLILPRLGRLVLERTRATGAEKALFLLAVLMALATAAEVVGAEDILGAFLAGVGLNRVVRGRVELHEHLAFVGRMLFVPFFFISTGMRLDLGVFVGELEVWLLAGALVAVVVTAKAAASWGTGAAFGYSRLDRMAMTGLSLPQAAATLAVMVTAREQDLVDARMLDAVIVVIFLTCLAGPLIVQAVGRRLTSEAPPGKAPAD